jgi:hypothetical protein
LLVAQENKDHSCFEHVELGQLERSAGAQRAQSEMGSHSEYLRGHVQLEQVEFGHQDIPNSFLTDLALRLRVVGKQERELLVRRIDVRDLLVSALHESFQEVRVQVQRLGLEGAVVEWLWLGQVVALVRAGGFAGELSSHG